MISVLDVLRRDVPLVFGFGGGVNTMAALILLHRKGVRPDLISFADTGDEKPETYAYRDDIATKWCLEHQFPEIVVIKKESPRVRDASLEEECL